MVDVSMLRTAEEARLRLPLRYPLHLMKLYITHIVTGYPGVLYGGPGELGRSAEMSVLGSSLRHLAGRQIPIRPPLSPGI